MNFHTLHIFQVSGTHIGMVDVHKAVVLMPQYFDQQEPTIRQLATEFQRE